MFVVCFLFVIFQYVNCCEWYEVECVVVCVNVEYVCCEWQQVVLEVIGNFFGYGVVWLVWEVVVQVVGIDW